MITNTFIHSLNQFSAVLLPVLLMTLIKSTILFAIVALLIRAFHVNSLKTKYALWVWYVFSVVLIAIITVVSPAFKIPFLQISPHRVKENIILSSLLFPQNEALSTATNYTIESSVHLQQESYFSSYLLNWTFWIMCGWITGIVFSLLHTLTGRIGVKYISRNTSQHKISYFKTEISHLSRDLGIKSKINIVVSYRCRLPFTYNFSHPVLVIPYEAIDWPKSKLRTILKHELSHIQRHDYLILSLSRFICSVLWFIPVIWIAHAHLQLEQEKICDSVAIEEGERPTVYARYMLDLARTARSLVLWSGIFIIKRRNTMLEKRLTNILGTRQSLIHEKFSRKKSNFLSILIIFIILIIAASSASGKKILSTDDAMKKLEGVYINTEYSGYIDLYPQMRIIFSDGKMETYNKATNGSPTFKAEYSIEESWSDSTGVIYSTVVVEWTPTGNTSLELWKLDQKGDIFEVNFNLYSLYEDVNHEYPTKIDPSSETFPKSIYSIWYRQE